MLSDPKCRDHILPFIQPGDVPRRIALTDADRMIRAMHAADGQETGDVTVDVVTTRSQAVSKLLASSLGSYPAPSATSNSGDGARIVRIKESWLYS